MPPTHPPRQAWTSDKKQYVAHDLTLLQEIRMWRVVGTGSV